MRKIEWRKVKWKIYKICDYSLTFHLHFLPLQQQVPRASDGMLSCRHGNVRKCDWSMKAEVVEFLSRKFSSKWDIQTRWTRTFIWPTSGKRIWRTSWVRRLTPSILIGISTIQSRSLNCALKLSQTTGTVRTLEFSTQAFLNSQLFLAHPYYNEIVVCENRCLLSDVLDVETLPLTELTAHIKDDAFWKRMFMSRWANLLTNTTNGKRWIEIHIEKHLATSLENLKPKEYNVERMKSLIELCSPFVRRLKIDHLEAFVESNDPTNDHIPFDVILERLNELKSLSVTYDCKTIGIFFQLGVTTITDNDIKKFVNGLSHTDLEEFEFHSSKLEASMLKQIGRALDKTTSLTRISLPNCRFGDAGLMEFIRVLTHDSLPNMKHIVLSNNFISSDGAVKLSNILRRRKIETIEIKLNPILAEGVIHMLALAGVVGLNYLNVSSCSFDESVGEALLHVLKFNKTLRHLDLSINKLGEELGLGMIEAIKSNSFMRNLDIRNTEIQLKTKSKIDAMILENREKRNTIQA